MKFRHGWRAVALGEVLTRITYGFTNPMPTTREGPYMVTAKDIRNGRIDYESARRTSWDDYADRLTDKSRPRVGDVLLTKDGSIGRVAVCDRPDVCINQSVALLQPSEHVSSEFLAYLLQAPRYQALMESDSGGSTIKHIYITRVDKMQIVIPTLDQQRAIARLLGALDDKIAANRELVILLSVLTAAEFAALADCEEPERVTDLAESLKRGVAPSYVEDGGLAVINQKCVRDRTISLGPSRLTAESKRTDGRLLERDDVLVNSTGQGTLGRMARWTRDDLRAVCDSHVTVVRFNPTTVDAACAGLALVQLENQIEALAEGSTGQTELRRELLGSVCIRVPARSQQARFGRVIRNRDESITALQAESDLLLGTRDELLPLLMSGKITVKAAESLVEGVV